MKLIRRLGAGIAAAATLVLVVSPTVPSFADGPTTSIVHVEMTADASAVPVIITATFTSADPAAPGLPAFGGQLTATGAGTFGESVHVEPDGTACGAGGSFFFAGSGEPSLTCLVEFYPAPADVGEGVAVAIADLWDSDTSSALGADATSATQVTFAPAEAAAPSWHVDTTMDSDAYPQGGTATVTSVIHNTGNVSLFFWPQAVFSVALQEGNCIIENADGSIVDSAGQLGAGFALQAAQWARCPAIYLVTADPGSSVSIDVTISTGSALGQVSADQTSVMTASYAVMTPHPGFVVSSRVSDIPGAPPSVTWTSSNTGDVPVVIDLEQASFDGAGQMLSNGCTVDDAEGAQVTFSDQSNGLDIPVGGHAQCEDVYLFAGGDAGKTLTQTKSVTATTLVGTAVGPGDASVLSASFYAGNPSWHVATTLDAATYLHGATATLTATLVNTGDTAVYASSPAIAAAASGFAPCATADGSSVLYASTLGLTIDLEPGQTLVCTATYVVTAAPGSTVIVDATLTGDSVYGTIDPDDTSVMTATYTVGTAHPGFTVASDPFYQSGGLAATVDWTVGNTGDVPLTVDLATASFDGAGEMVTTRCWTYDAAGGALAHSPDGTGMVVPPAGTAICTDTYYPVASDMGKTLTQTIAVTATTADGTPVRPGAASVLSASFVIPTTAALPAARASLHVASSADKAEVPLGEVAKYTVTLSNTGTTAITDLRIVDALSSSVAGAVLHTSGACSSPGHWYVPEFTGVVDPPAPSPDPTGLTLAPGEDATCTIMVSYAYGTASNGDVPVAAGDTLTNTVAVTGVAQVDGARVAVNPDGTSTVSATATLVTPAPGLHVTKTVTDDNASDGTATYTITAENTGNVDYWVGIDDDNVASGPGDTSAFTGAGEPPSAWTCDVFDAAGTWIMRGAHVRSTTDPAVNTWLVDVPAGGHAVFRGDYAVIDPVGATVSNTVDVTGWWPLNSPAHTVDPDASSVLTASFTVVSAAPGMTVTYSADGLGTRVNRTVRFSTMIENTGNVPLLDVTIDAGDFGGQGTVENSMSCGIFDSAGNPVGDAQSETGPVVTLTTPIPVRGSARCDSYYDVAPADAGTTVTSTVLVTASAPDGSAVPPGDTSALSADIAVEPIGAELWVMKSEWSHEVVLEDGPVPVGTIVYYDIYLENLGDVGLQQVVLTDTFEGAGTPPQLECWVWVPDDPADPRGDGENQPVDVTDGSLRLPASWGSAFCEGTYTVVPADAGSTVTNRVDATATAVVDGVTVDVRAVRSDVEYGDADLSVSFLVAGTKPGGGPTTTITQPTGPAPTDNTGGATVPQPTQAPGVTVKIPAGPSVGGGGAAGGAGGVAGAALLVVAAVGLAGWWRARQVALLNPGRHGA
ncbi:MAG: hypothetical protein FWC46_03405 [Actinomycetia bacterium]|nr:hypothetical protein [Actinomycetes bacterium]